MTPFWTPQKWPFLAIFGGSQKRPPKNPKKPQKDLIFWEVFLGFWDFLGVLMGFLGVSQTRPHFCGVFFRIPLISSPKNTPFWGYFWTREALVESHDNQNFREDGVPPLLPPSHNPSARRRESCFFQGQKTRREESIR